MSLHSVLFNDTWSQQMNSMSRTTMLFLWLQYQQIRNQATRTCKVGCQPGDCIWPLSSSGVCVGIYGLTYSLYHPQGSFKKKIREKKTYWVHH